MPVICAGAEPCFAPGQTPVTGRATAPMTSPHAAAPAEPRSNALRRDGDCWGEGTRTWTSHSIRGHAMRAARGMEPTVGAAQERHMSRSRTSAGAEPQVGRPMVGDGGGEGHAGRSGAPVWGEDRGAVATVRLKRGGRPPRGLVGG